jgi:hypothetical protein
MFSPVLRLVKFTGDWKQGHLDRPKFFSTYLTENAPYFHYNYQSLDFIFTQKIALFF